MKSKSIMTLREKLFPYSFHRWRRWFFSLPGNAVIEEDSLEHGIHPGQVLGPDPVYLAQCIIDRDGRLEESGRCGKMKESEQCKEERCTHRTCCLSLIPCHSTVIVACISRGVKSAVGRGLNSP